MLSVGGSRELQATVLALKQMDSTVRKEIYKHTRAQLVPEWREALATEATTLLEQKVILGGTRVELGAEKVTLKAAQSTRKLSGGGSPQRLAAAVEFGAETRKGTATRGGTTYTRTLNSAFKGRRRQGYVAWPTAAKLAPRFASLWVQTCIRTMYEAVEGRAK
jgi:hypothetical protein